MKTKNYTSKGQALIEIMFVIAIITLSLAAFVFAGTRSVKTTTSTNTRSIATKYAQEGLEMVRQLRDRNWSGFQSYDGFTMCPRLDTSSWSNGACIVGDIYTRGATFEWEPVKRQMTVTVKVEWTDESGTHDSSLTTIFTRL